MTLNELVGELEREGVFLPDLIRADLRNAKMVLEYLGSFSEDISADSNDTDLQAEISAKVLSLKETIIKQAAERGEEYRKKWELRIEEALEGQLIEDDTESKTPISDIPRDKDTGFFRIKLPDEIPVEIVSEMAEDCRVNISLDGERHLQVSGSRECVRDAMRRLGELFYGESKLK
jgi:hypothetical protein